MTATPDGSAAPKAAQHLQDLGLTATEAAVYCAALQLCTSEPVSSYKLAQAVGRDPANVAKTLTALVRLQAMTIVQDKPRLYLPTDPGDFTKRVLDRLQHSGEQAVELLHQFQVPQPAGVTLPLDGPEQIFSQARTILAGCQTSAVVFGAKECLREIGAELEALADTDGRCVRVLSPVAMVSEKVEIAVFSPVSDLAGLLAQDFLQLVVDDRVWLSALPNAGTGQVPQGWWGDVGPIAKVLSGALTLAWSAGHSGAPTVEPPAQSPEIEPQPAPSPPASQTPEVESTPETESGPEPEFEEGLTFLIRHSEEKDQN